MFVWVCVCMGWKGGVSFYTPVDTVTSFITPLSLALVRHRLHTQGNGCVSAPSTLCVCLCVSVCVCVCEIVRESVKERENVCDKSERCDQVYVFVFQADCQQPVCPYMK